MTELPGSYTSNSVKEKEILTLAENFLRQFSYLYPLRPIPPLYLENECKVKKLVCTSLCPSVLKKTTELVHWKDCACFVSDFFQQDLLEAPLDYPTQLPSMGIILERRRGNSLELSMVLCTLLLSTGFDAYVVHGYAARDVTEKIERHKGDPLLTLPRKFRRYEALFHENPNPPASEPERKSKYFIDLLKAKKYWMEGIIEEAPEVPEKQVPIVKAEEDPLFGKRVHFWVLLLKTENDSFPSTFLEPTTGEVMPLDSEKYLGIEFVWNAKNFWSNKQKLMGGGLSFDFGDIGIWDAFLPEYVIHKPRRTPGYKHFIMPETWVRDVEITQKDVNNRFHSDGKHERYRTVRIDRYNPGTLSNGLVLKVVYYDEENAKKSIKVHEFFTGRGDHMEYRIKDCGENIVKEWFARGREDALKEHVYHSKRDSSFVQTMVFYSRLRKDGLSTIEWSNRTLKMVFEGRDDLLVMREAAYDGEVSFNPEEERDGSETDSGDDEDTEMNAEGAPIVDGSQEETTTDQEESNEQGPEESIELGPEEKEEGELDGQVEAGERDETEPVDKEEKEQREPEDDEEGEEQEPEGGTVEIAYLSSGIRPVHFKSQDPLYVDADLTKWSYHAFLESIDPAERYASSESDSEDQVPQKATTQVEENGQGPPVERVGELETAESDIPTEDEEKELIEDYQEIDSESRENEGDTEKNVRDDQKVKGQEIVPESQENEGNRVTGVKDGQEMSGQEIYSETQEKEGDTEAEVKDNQDNNGQDIDSESQEKKGDTDTHVKDSLEKMDLVNKEDEINMGDLENTETEAEDSMYTDEDEPISDSIKETQRDRKIFSLELDCLDLLDETSEITDDYDESNQIEEDSDVFDDINFDALSDEELEIDYQMYLRKLWNKFRSEKQIDLFYMQKEFQIRRDMRKKEVLRKKKNIIKKRRENIRFIERKEQGCPSIRFYKRKSEEMTEKRKGLHTNDLIRHLNMKSLNIPDVCDLTEFYEMNDLDEKYIKDAEEEIIQIESLKVMKKRLIKFSKDKTLDKHLLWIKRNFSKNTSNTTDISSIKTIWYMLDTKTYRIDYYSPQDKCSPRTLILTKPLGNTTQFSFCSYLCRQIIPAQEMTKISRAKLYSLLVGLIREEEIVLEKHHSSERELEHILKERSEALLLDKELLKQSKKQKVGLNS